MARTAIPITTVAPFAGGAALSSGVAGDSVNDHAVAGGNVQRLHLLATNTNAATVPFDVEIPSGSATYNEAVTKTHTVPAAAAGVEGKHLVVLDASTMVQSDGTIYVSGSDANFGDLTFYAYTWQPTSAP